MRGEKNEIVVIFFTTADSEAHISKGKKIKHRYAEKLAKLFSTLSIDSKLRNFCLIDRYKLKIL